MIQTLNHCLYVYVSIIIILLMDKSLSLSSLAKLILHCARHKIEDIVQLLLVRGGFNGQKAIVVTCNRFGAQRKTLWYSTIIVLL